MPINILLRLLMVVVSVFIASTVYAESALLWKVEKAGQQASYIFGTMHSEDSRVLAALEHVSDELDQQRCLALELDLNPANAAKVMQAMFFNDGNNLQKLLDKALYEQVMAIATAQYGVGAMQMNAMKPWAMMMTISAPKPETGMFLDRALYLYAVEKNYTIIGLETPEEQIAVFDGMSMNDQITLLKSAADTYDDMPEMFERLVESYVTQDLVMMQTLYDEYTSEQDAAFVAELTERLLDARNKLMVTRMQALFNERGCFVAVGALHLPGDKGLVKMMKSLGYDLKPIQLQF